MANQENGKESFLQRWSRLKRAGDPPEPAPARAPDDLPTAAQELPDAESVDALDFSSDFSRFLQPKVEEMVKRAALKKLFHSPHFNQMDGLDVYIDDYNKFEPIPEEMLRQLTHAKDMLFGGERDAAAPADASPASSRSSDAPHTGASNRDSQAAATEQPSKEEGLGQAAGGSQKG